MLNFKKNQKQFMAIFSVGLMIAFALPTAVSNYSKSREVDVGVAGNKKVTNKDLAQAKMEWEALKQVRIERSNPSDPTAPPQVIPITEVVLGPAKSLEIQNNPELYYLLMLEADRMGVTVSQDQVHELLVNRSKFDDDHSTDAELAPVLENFLKVVLASRRASASLQVSAPEVQSALSKLQAFSLTLTEFKAQDYLAKVPPYTETQKLQRATELYNTYKDYEPTTRPANPKTGQPQNDFSFGYRLPNQVQTQYIEIPRDAIIRLVKPKITEVEAIKYYLANKDKEGKFPSTRAPQEVTFRASPPPPTVSPTSQPTTRAAVPKVFTDEVSVTTNQPLGAPPMTFKDYRDKIYDELTAQRAEQLANDILADVSTVMAADYLEFKKSPAGQMITATSTSMPSTAPAVPNSSLGVPYSSYEYLQKLALREQEKFQLLPTVGQDLGLRSPQQLQGSPGIGQAQLPEFGAIISALSRQTRDFNQIFQTAAIATYPGYAANLIESLTNANVNQLARMFRLRTIALFEPSPLMQSGAFTGKEPSGGEFIFRAVQAVPNHPAPQGDVMNQLLADVLLKDAYELARKDAEKLATDAEKSRLDVAAPAAGKKIVTTGLIDRRLPADLGAYPIADNATKSVFINSAYNLLANGQKNQQHPVGIIDLRPTGSVLVAQVNEIKPLWSQNTLTAYERLIKVQSDNASQSNGGAIWFDANDIMRRMQYHELIPSKKSSSPSPAPQDNGQQEQNPFTP